MHQGRPANEQLLTQRDTMLPESKVAFPKLLRLDQNKWIDLARAHYGRPSGEAFHDALAAVRRAVNANKLIVPFSLVTITEIQGDHHPDRRERLIRFMIDLSRNRTVLPFLPIRSWEVRSAVYALFGRPEPGCIRPSIVRQGVANALGLRTTISGVPPEFEPVLLQIMHAPETAVELLLSLADKDAEPDTMRAEETANRPFQEDVRRRAAAEITVEQRSIAELLDYMRRGDVGTALTDALQEFGVSLPDFYWRFPAARDFIAFFAGVPTLDVNLTLTIGRDQDLVRRIQRNDVRDVIALSVAVPYGNIVVAEKYWGTMVRSRGLAAKYNTIVLTDLRELPACLAKMGCV
jgi:hypothetical protein